MIEKAADITRRVERDELVQHARRQAVLGKRPPTSPCPK